METVAAMGSTTLVLQMKESAVPLTDALVGVAVTTIDNSVKGITVSSELERLVDKCGVFDNRSSVMPKAHLYDKDKFGFFGVNPAFKESKEGARYRKAMTLVAMAISDQDWKAFHDGKMDSLAKRNTFSKVEKDTMEKTISIELQLGLRKPGKKIMVMVKPTLHILDTRFRKIIIIGRRWVQ